jgi:hypothetical protein
MARFQHTLDNCELIELALQNHRYTNDNILHWFGWIGLFCNKEWNILHSGFSLQSLSSSMSDHCPLLLCPQDKLRRKEIFRFKNLWVRIPGFLEVIKEA